MPAVLQDIKNPEKWEQTRRAYSLTQLLGSVLDYNIRYTDHRLLMHDKMFSFKQKQQYKNVVNHINLAKFDSNEMDEYATTLSEDGNDAKMCDVLHNEAAQICRLVMYWENATRNNPDAWLKIESMLKMMCKGEPYFPESEIEFFRPNINLSFYEIE